MRVSFNTILFAGLLAATPGFAQSMQTSEDIIKFFGNAADLGASRGICVGTEEECKAKTEAATAAAQTGLDMLINFDLDSASLTPDARAKLAEFAKALQDNRLKSHAFLVEGHTDASGGVVYNEGLSQRRAQSVAAFLLANGIDASRLTAVGMGKSKPRVANPYDAVNRRVEMRLKLQ